VTHRDRNTASFPHCYRESFPVVLYDRSHIGSLVTSTISVVIQEGLKSLAFTSLEYSIGFKPRHRYMSGCRLNRRF
jgi:hypothetical protein